MKKIAFIAPSQEMLDIGSKVIAELGIAEYVESNIGFLEEGVALACKAESEGADVIVTRGGTAELMAKTGIQIPMIEIPVAVQDLAEALLRAKEITGQEMPKIAVVAFKNMMANIEVFKRVMNISLLVYPISVEDEIEPGVRAAVAEGADVIIGGIRTVELAGALGKNTFMLVSGEESYRIAFVSALKVSYARTLEKERMERFRMLVDYSAQGIIGVENNGVINVFNPAAERLLRVNAEEAVGMNVSTLLADLPLPRPGDTVKPVLGKLVKINGESYMVNMMPIHVSGDMRGMMLTVEDVDKIVEMEAAIRKEMYSKGLTAQYSFADIWGASPQITEVKRVAREYAGIDATVLITGASGTGKELFAQSVHQASRRSRGPFVAVNCGAIALSLLESELFGYAEGAFTGANKKGKAGYFELAHGGTIFLDEIGEMNKQTQASLLRVIQERRVMRVGGDRYVPVDIRIIAATNKNLVQMIREGKFREDLFYRLNVLTLELPAVKEREGDALLIAGEFVAIYNKRFGKKVRLSPKVRSYIARYEWPGNVRQLRNFIERLVITTPDHGYDDELYVPAFAVAGAIAPEGKQASLPENPGERLRIISVLEQTGYNKKEAARLLGMDRSTLYRKLRQLNITVKKDVQHMQ